MKYCNLTLGQIEAGINIVGGEDAWIKLLRGELKVVPVGGSSVFELTKQHNPKKFYQTGKGLYIYDGFTTRILSTTVPTKAGKKFGEVISYKLTKYTTGEEWLRNHPNDIWEATNLCAWLSIQITLQFEGQDGFLPNDGNFNLLLARGAENQVFVVSVYWSSGTRRWYVHAWALDDGWDSGTRFFSKPTD